MVGSTVTALFKILIGILDKEDIDNMLDIIEDKVAATETKIDDIVVLAIINAIRAALGIPDGED